MATVYDDLMTALLAESCASCRVAKARGFCSACVDAFPAIENACPGCALPQPVRRCPRGRPTWRIGTVVAPFAFAFPVDNAIHALKFHRARSLGRAFGLLLADRLREQARHIDAIVAVPLHRRRLISRGYNQALEIARPLAKTLSVPLRVTGICRCAPTPEQTALSAADRVRNVARAFSVTRDFSGQRIAIVDDVITTGATVNALGAALEAAGATQVHAWAVARTLVGNQPRKTKSKTIPANT
jgi:ComF family protein